MDVSGFVVLHITAGTLALVSGAVALVARKGATLHRLAGSVFFIAMLAMCAAAIPIAIVRGQTLNVAAASLTAYLVATAWVAATRKDGKIGAFESSALVYVLAVAAGAALAGQASTDGAAPFLYGFASIAAIAGLFDVSVIWRGSIAGAQRIARHLWRMSFAMLIATASFFIGQPKFVPTVLRETNLNLVPVIAVILLLLFWLVRVLATNWYKADAQSMHDVK